MAPPKRRPSASDEQENVPSASVTMSNEQFLALINELRQSAKLSNDELLENFRDRGSTPINVQTVTPSGNFAKCTARFDGSDSSDVEAFIDCVLTYKDCTNVSNENALRGLSMLLENAAATWWQGVKSTVQDWNSAVTLLKDTYSKTLPSHLIYREIFSREQNVDETTELFVSRLRALISKLSYDLPIEAQLDMVYGLLHRKIRKRLPRDSFQDFNMLLTKSRDIERSLKEITNPHDSNGNMATEVRSQDKRGDTKKNRPRCIYCKNVGHVVDECKKLAKKNAATTSSVSAQQAKSSVSSEGSPSSSSTKLVCYGCNTPGYVRSKCPNCQSHSVSSSDSTKEVKSVGFYQTTLCSTNSELISRPLLPISISNIEGVGFADSGAQISIAGNTLYDLLQQKGYNFEESKVCLSYADGVVREENILTTNVDISIKDKVVPFTFTILPHLQNNHTLLGVDFFKKAKVVLNIPDGYWYFSDDPNKHYPFISEYCIPKNIQLFELGEHGLRNDEGVSLTFSQRQTLNELLSQHSIVFEPGGGPTDFAIHKIKTIEHDPIAVPPYPLSKAKKEFLKEELDKLLSANIIEECESPWAAPVVLVPKKDGKLRLCVDYRRLNSITIADSYPMPKIDDLLHTAKRTKFMSTIDLQSGFWQVPVAPEDKDKTCFVTPYGTFRFNRMPFGMKNSPATFVRLMDRFRAGLGDRSVFAYLDDILVLSETFEQHLDDLKATFDRLLVFKLRARRDKCVFVRDSVKYLGHLITPNGIQADSDKVLAIQSLNPPTCVKHVQSFVQTCSWFRKFIPDFAEISRPLTNLLKKNQSFKFGQEEKQAFETLKEKLISAPILVQADQDKPYILRTDASHFALGAVLLQGEGNMERPIEYASRLLSASERNYSAIEREALCIVWSCTEKFRTYLEGAEVTVATDHQPLQWLFSLKTPSGRLARWALRLQGMNMKITYTPGKMNVLADTLSRPFCVHSDNTSCTICFTSVEMPKFCPNDIRQKQLSDPELEKIISALENQDSCEITRWSERGYLLLNGVLYKYSHDLDSEEAQLVIPEQCRAEILKLYHDSDVAGHYGVERTLQKISNKFYFTGMRRYIADYVKNCIDCQRYKATNLKPSGLLQTPAPSQRFEIIAVDLFGPLPETPSQNRWILVVEDIASKWIELFALQNATAEACAKVMIENVFLRFGTPRKMISDNGVQFISDIMQKVTFCFGIKNSFIPLYHPESNPVERKNRDLKTQLSILVKDKHDTWDIYLPSIRFAMNSTVCESTGKTPAFLTFGREVRAPHDNIYDMRQIVDAENYVPRITPYLQKLSSVLCETHETLMEKQDKRKEIVDKYRDNVYFKVGDKVLLKTHTLSNIQKGYTAKFATKRDGPYVISKVITPNSYEVSTLDEKSMIVGKYHASDIYPYHSKDESTTPVPVEPKRKRGRLKKKI